MTVMSGIVIYGLVHPGLLCKHASHTVSDYRT